MEVLGGVGGVVFSFLGSSDQGVRRQAFSEFSFQNSDAVLLEAHGAGWLGLIEGQARAQLQKFQHMHAYSVGPMRDRSGGLLENPRVFARSITRKQSPPCRKWAARPSGGIDTPGL